MHHRIKNVFNLAETFLWEVENSLCRNIHQITYYMEFILSFESVKGRHVGACNHPRIDNSNNLPVYHSVIQQGNVKIIILLTLRFMV